MALQHRLSSPAATDTSAAPLIPRAMTPWLPAALCYGIYTHSLLEQHWPRTYKVPVRRCYGLCADRAALPALHRAVRGKALRASLWSVPSSPWIAAPFPARFICLHQALLHTTGVTLRCQFVQQPVSLLTPLETTFSFYTATSCWQHVIIP